MCLADTLVAVLERDTLGIREVRLFGAVVRWSEAECQRQQLQVVPENKRKVLGKALALIRFPLMTIEEFAAGNHPGSALPALRELSALPVNLNRRSFPVPSGLKKNYWACPIPPCAPLLCVEVSALCQVSWGSCLPVPRCALGSLLFTAGLIQVVPRRAQPPGGLSAFLQWEGRWC